MESPWAVAEHPKYKEVFGQFDPDVFYILKPLAEWKSLAKKVKDQGFNCGKVLKVIIDLEYPEKPKEKNCPICSSVMK